MNVDLHTHTYPASTCSGISLSAYVEWCVRAEVEAVALTNHGDLSDNRALEGTLAAEGVLLVHGVEISTMYGDFVIFSPDLDYLERFDDVQAFVPADALPEDAASVWVHPGAGGGRSQSVYFPGLERTMGHLVHGIEVYNGSWLEDRFVERAESIADQFGLARTGGSDAHDPADLMRCYTTVPDPVRSTSDIVSAIKRRQTVPQRPAPSRRKRFGLF